MSNWEAKFGIEHDLVGNTMWGDDYPHPRAPGRTPRGHGVTFCDIDPKYVRQYLGDVAIDVYGLDRARLAGRRPDRPDGGRPVVGLRPARGETRGCTPSAPARGSSSDGRGRRAGRRRAGRSPPRSRAPARARLGEAEAVRRPRRPRPDARPAREQMGEGTDNPLPPGLERRSPTGARARYFNAQLAGAARPGRPAPDRRDRQERTGAAGPPERRRRPGIRYYQDLFVPKLPSSKASRHGGNGRPRSTRTSSPSPSTGPAA